MALAELSPGASSALKDLLLGEIAKDVATDEGKRQLLLARTSPELSEQVLAYSEDSDKAATSTAGTDVDATPPVTISRDDAPLLHAFLDAYGDETKTASLFQELLGFDPLAVIA